MWGRIKFSSKLKILICMHTAFVVTVEEIKVKSDVETEMAEKQEYL